MWLIRFAAPGAYGTIVVQLVAVYFDWRTHTEMKGKDQAETQTIYSGKCIILAAVICV